MFKIIIIILICSLSHPNHQIVRPKRYKNTSSSDNKKVITSRKDDQPDNSFDIEDNFNKIRDALNMNKENEIANVVTEPASPHRTNTSFAQSMS